MKINLNFTDTNIYIFNLLEQDGYVHVFKWSIAAVPNLLGVLHCSTMDQSAGIGRYCGRVILCLH